MAELLVEATLGDLPVRKWRFANGLCAILCRDARTPVLAYQTWLGVGSRDERPGKTGLAHLFEHLMFNETENLPAGEFDRRIEAVGGDTNASTWLDWTAYHTTASAEHLALVAELEAERFARLVLRERQVASERDVVANERRFRVEDDPDGFLNERLYAMAFDVHPYRWPTIGWMDDIRSFTPEDCVAFYRGSYAPDRATLVLAGGFAEEDAIGAIERFYGTLAPSAEPRGDAPAEPPPSGERRARFRKPVTVEKLVIGHRSPDLAHADHPALEVLNELLFGGRSARLWRKLVVDEIGSSCSGWVAAFRDPGVYEIQVALKRGHAADEAERIVLAEIARLCEEPAPDEEMEKARARLEAGFHWAMRSAAGKAQSLGHFEATTGDFRRLLDVPDAYRRATAEDVRRVARAYLRPEARCVLVVEPA